MLLEATPDFLKKYKSSQDFLLVADAFKMTTERKDPIKMFGAIAMFAAMVIINT